MHQSLAQKQSFVNKTLGRWDHTIHEIISVDEAQRWGYRTSVTLAAQYLDGKWLFGTKSLDEVIPIHQCPIHHSLVNTVVRILELALPSFEKFPMAYLSMSKAQCTLIVKSKPIEIFWFTDRIQEKFKDAGVSGLWVHFNPSAGRRLFEKGGWLHLMGEKRSFDSLGLMYGPTSFQQQIQSLYIQSLAKAEGFLKPSPQVAVVDLYCGTGTSLSKWQALGAQAIGVESGAESVDCAQINAPDAEVLRGACRLRVPQVAQWVNMQRSQQKEIVLYTNPPRTGMEPEVLEWIANSGEPTRIAYLSCSPGTLSKNLNFLVENGYRVESITPYDFFPNTYHVECLALLKLM
jgi:23S rRNA (uracil1939-C5)-methyltransferase